MDCRDYEQLLSQYLDGDLERKQYEALRFHLSGCPHCTALCADMQQTVQALRQIPRIVPRPEFREALRSRLHQEVTNELYRTPVWRRLQEHVWLVNQGAVRVGLAASLIVAAIIGVTRWNGPMLPQPTTALRTAPLRHPASDAQPMHQRLIQTVQRDVNRTVTAEGKREHVSQVVAQVAADTGSATSLTPAVTPPAEVSELAVASFGPEAEPSGTTVFPVVERNPLIARPVTQPPVNTFTPPINRQEGARRYLLQTIPSSRTLRIAF